MKLRTLSTGMAIALHLTLVTNISSAQQPSAQDQAAAEGLFADAKKLMGEGNYGEACPKFEESQRLDPAPGTQFNLGECYEHIGRTASAWALFLNVAAAAKSANMPDREKVARDRAAALEPKLPKLVILVPSPAPGLEVKRDGVLVGQAQYGSSVAIDPGKHPVTASAPGKEPWSTTVDVGPDGATISVPALTDAVVKPVAPAADFEASVPERGQRGLGSQRTLALVAAGVGVVGLGVGSVFGLKDMSKLSDAESHCTGNACDATGVALRDDAMSAGNISTIAFSVGLVAIAGAAVLWFTAPASSSSASRAAAVSRFRTSASFGHGSGGAIVGGVF
jgi:hypothetical protein